MKSLVTKRDKRQSEKITPAKTSTIGRQMQTRFQLFAKCDISHRYCHLELVFLYKTRYATCRLLCFWVTQFFSLWHLSCFVTKLFIIRIYIYIYIGEPHYYGHPQEWQVNLMLR